MPGFRLATIGSRFLLGIAAFTLQIAAFVVAVALTTIDAQAFGDEPTPPAALHDEIDQWIERRLVDWRIQPAEISDDAEFLRRVSLDVTGLIPTAAQARDFLDDQRPDKRQRLIDELLASPEHAIHLARVLDVWLIERRIPTISSYDVPAAQWRTFLTRAVAENRPWNELVRDILRSDGTGEHDAAGVKFYLVRDVAPHALTRDVGRLFLGIDLQCAQCHDDPRFESYRQSDYYGIYAFLQRVTAFRDSQKNVSLVGETASGKTSFTSVFTAMSGDTQPRLPGGEMIPDPEVEKDKEYVVKPGPKDRGVPAYSRRLKLAELLPRAETPGFARNIVNRMWALLLGRGLVHPLDLHHAGNLPSHPELLDHLDQWFVAHQFDLRGLLREILLSRTYQRASVVPPGQAPPRPDAFAVAPLRGLSPEQLSWSILQATGRLESQLRVRPSNRPKSSPAPQPMATAASGAAPSESQAAAPPAWQTRLAALDPLDRQVKPLVAVFAGLPGQPDGDFQPIVDQALHLLNGPAMLPLVRDPPSTLVDRLVAIEQHEALSDELYLSVLSRRATAEEATEVGTSLAAAANAAERRDRITSLAWGLLLSAEFRLNH